MHPAAIFLAPAAAGRHLRPPFHRLHRLLHSHSSLPSHPEVDCSVRCLCDCLPPVASPLPAAPRLRPTSPGVPSSSTSPPIQPVSPSEETKSVPFIGAGIPLLLSLLSRPPPATCCRRRQTSPVEVFPPSSPPTRGTPGRLPRAFLLPARVTQPSTALFSRGSPGYLPRQPFSQPGKFGAATLYHFVVTAGIFLPFLMCPVAGSTDLPPTEFYCLTAVAGLC